MTDPASDDLPEQVAGQRPRLRAFALTLARDEDEADELVQETCARAIGARAHYTEDGRLRAWLFTILRNLHHNRTRDASRGIGRVMRLDESERLDAVRPIPSAEEEALRRADRTAIADAFRSLPPDFAAPLQLAVVEDMSYAEIAAVLGIPAGTVMSRIYRARRLILRALAEDDTA